MKQYLIFICPINMGMLQKTKAYITIPDNRGIKSLMCAISSSGLV